MWSWNQQRQALLIIMIILSPNLSLFASSIIAGKLKDLFRQEIKNTTPHRNVFQGEIWTYNNNYLRKEKTKEKAIIGPRI